MPRARYLWCPEAAPGAMALQVRLKRSDRVYRPGELVQGVVVCTSDPGSPMAHSGIKMKVSGVVQMQLSPKNVGLFEAF